MYAKSTVNSAHVVTAHNGISLWISVVIKKLAPAHHAYRLTLSLFVMSA
jgi:hypothetical protein